MKITKKQLQEMIQKEAKRQLKLQENAREKVDLIARYRNYLSHEELLNDLAIALPERELRSALDYVEKMNGFRLDKE